MKFLVITVLLFSAASVFGQDSEIAKANEGLAAARLTAAKTIPTVTPQQCTAALVGWEARDESDTKAHAQPPNYWFEKLSTEELTRLVAESLACGGSYKDVRFLSRTAMFLNEVCGRSERVLRENGLIHELLLVPSQ